jgi:transcriptional regulator with XRE-family HTH domain
MDNGALVRSARERAGITQAELAKRLNTSQPAVARLESAKANPRLGTLRRAVAATGHTLDFRVVKARGSSIDESLVAAALKRTPAERLADFTAAYKSVSRLRAHARRP